MKYLLFILFLIPLSLFGQYRYSYTEMGIDSGYYELTVREDVIFIDLCAGEPLVVPFDSLYYDLCEEKNVALGRWTVVWDDKTLVCSEKGLIRFVMTDRKKQLNIFKTRT